MAVLLLRQFLVGFPSCDVAVTPLLGSIKPASRWHRIPLADGGIESSFLLPSSELVIGLLCHGAKHANSHRVVLLLWLLMRLKAPFHGSESCSTLIKKA